MPWRGANAASNTPYDDDNKVVKNDADKKKGKYYWLTFLSWRFFGVNSYFQTRKLKKRQTNRSPKIEPLRTFCACTITMLIGFGSWGFGSE